MRPNAAACPSAGSLGGKDPWTREPQRVEPRASPVRILAISLLSFALGVAVSVWLSPAVPTAAAGPDTAVLTQLTGAEYVAASAAGLGSPFAPTVPLLGVAEPHDRSSVFDAAIESKDKDFCAPLTASVQVHGELFKGPGGQQDAQRQFLAAVPTTLCADPTQSEEQYLELLHGMLATVRTAINRHVQSAFYVKAACAQTLPHGGTENEACLGTVLFHEGYNLVEGYYVVELTLGLIIRGAAFCTDPSRDELLLKWRDELEAVMAHHRGNSAFEVLAGNVRDMGCPDSYEEGAAAEYAAKEAAVAEKLRCEMHRPDSDKVCVFSRPDEVPFVRSNPPDLLDAITILEQNTHIALGLAATGARRVLVSEGCLDERGEVQLSPQSERAAQLIAQIDASGLLLPPYARSGGRVRFSFAEEGNVWEGNSTFPLDPVGSDTIIMLSLPTVYHKLVSTCVINEDMEGGMPSMCEGAPQVEGTTHLHGSTGEDNPVFDITTSTDITKCSGEACKAAAKAVLDYQSMLGPLTRMRWDLIQVAFGTVPAMPVLSSTSWVRQRSCAAFTNIATNAAAVQAQLPAVLQGLRASTDQLSLACVAPRRVGYLVADGEQGNGGFADFRLPPATTPCA